MADDTRDAIDDSVLDPVEEPNERDASHLLSPSEVRSPHEDPDDIVASENKFAVKAHQKIESETEVVQSSVSAWSMYCCAVDVPFELSFLNRLESSCDKPFEWLTTKIDEGPVMCGEETLQCGEETLQCGEDPVEASSTEQLYHQGIHSAEDLGSNSTVDPYEVFQKFHKELFLSESPNNHQTNLYDTLPTVPEESELDEKTHDPSILSGEVRRGQEWLQTPRADGTEKARPIESFDLMTFSPGTAPSLVHSHPNSEIIDRNPVNRTSDLDVGEPADAWLESFKIQEAAPSQEPDVPVPVIPDANVNQSSEGETSQICIPSSQVHGDNPVAEGVLSSTWQPGERNPDEGEKECVSVSRGGDDSPLETLEADGMHSSKPSEEHSADATANDATDFVVASRGGDESAPETIETDGVLSSTVQVEPVEEQNADADTNDLVLASREGDEALPESVQLLDSKPKREETHGPVVSVQQESESAIRDSNANEVEELETSIAFDGHRAAEPDCSGADELRDAVEATRSCLGSPKTDEDAHEDPLSPFTSSTAGVDVATIASETPIDQVAPTWKTPISSDVFHYYEVAVAPSDELENKNQGPPPISVATPSTCAHQQQHSPSYYFCNGFETLPEFCVSTPVHEVRAGIESFLRKRL